MNKLFLAFNIFLFLNIASIETLDKKRVKDRQERYEAICREGKVKDFIDFCLFSTALFEILHD